MYNNTERKSRRVGSTLAMVSMQPTGVLAVGKWKILGTTPGYGRTFACEALEVSTIVAGIESLYVNFVWSNIACV